MHNIIVTGSISWDVIMNFPSTFVEHVDLTKVHSLNANFVVSNLEKQFGGTATNIAYNLSLLTSKKVAIAAGIGKDNGEHLKLFKKHKIDTSLLVFDNKHFCATGTVITDTKDNQIWGFYYGACEMGKKVKLAKFAKKNTLVIVSANHPLAFMNAQKEAIKNKIPFMYDPGMALTWITKEQLREGIENCQFLIGNDYEVGQILKKAEVTENELLSKGKIVITTLGEKGVIYKAQVKSQKSKVKNASQKAKVMDIEEIYVEGYKLKKAVDPTGAGDAWRGGFIAGIAEGLSVTEALKQGNALASFAVEKYGTVNHLPTKKQITARARRLSISIKEYEE